MSAGPLAYSSPFVIDYFREVPSGEYGRARLDYTYIVSSREVRWLFWKSGARGKNAARARASFVHASCAYGLSRGQQQLEISLILSFRSGSFFFFFFEQARAAGGGDAERFINRNMCLDTLGLFFSFFFCFVGGRLLNGDFENKYDNRFP